jgi:hypothetical protein
MQPNGVFYVLHNLFIRISLGITSLQVRRISEVSILILLDNDGKSIIFHRDILRSIHIFPSRPHCRAFLEQSQIPCEKVENALFSYRELGTPMFSCVPKSVWFLSKHACIKISSIFFLPAYTLPRFPHLVASKLRWEERKGSRGRGLREMEKAQRSSKRLIQSKIYWDPNRIVVILLYGYNSQNRLFYLSFKRHCSSLFIFSLSHNRTSSKNSSRFWGILARPSTRRCFFEPSHFGRRKMGQNESSLPRTHFFSMWASFMIQL